MDTKQAKPNRTIWWYTKFVVATYICGWLIAGLILAIAVPRYGIPALDRIGVLNWFPAWALFFGLCVAPFLWRSRIR